MKIPQSKKTFIFLLAFILVFNFLPSNAKSNFKPPILNPTNLAFNGPIHAIAIDEMTGIVYVSGEFTKVGEIERSGLAAIGTDGNLTSWNPSVDGVHIPPKEEGQEVGPYRVINALAISGSTIYVGGVFTSINGMERNNLAAIGTNGILQNWNPNVSIGYVNALAVKDSIVYIGGEFSTIGGEKRNKLAAVSTDGVLQDWNPDAGMAGGVNALAIKDSIIYVGGLFNTIEGKIRNNLAAIGTDATLQSWNPDVSGGYFGSTVRTLAIKDSTIYAGGDLISMVSMGRGRNNLAAIGTDGILQNWNPSVNGSVNTLAINGSIIYVGGNFNKIEKKRSIGLAAIGTNGAVKRWNPNVFGSVRAVLISGSTIYVGGDFTMIGNEVRSRFASFTIPK